MRKGLADGKLDWCTRRSWVPPRLPRMAKEGDVEPYMEQGGADGLWLPRLFVPLPGPWYTAAAWLVHQFMKACKELT